MSAGTIPPESTDIKRTAVSWLFHQEAQTVLLFLIVLAICYGGWYAMDRAIPAHLDTIQKGYDRQQTNYDKSIDRVSKDYASQREEFIDIMREMAGKPVREHKTATNGND